MLLIQQFQIEILLIVLAVNTAKSNSIIIVCAVDTAISLPNIIIGAVNTAKSNSNIIVGAVNAAKSKLNIIAFAVGCELYNKAHQTLPDNSAFFVYYICSIDHDVDELV